MHWLSPVNQATCVPYHKVRKPHYASTVEATKLDLPVFGCQVLEHKELHWPILFQIKLLLTFWKIHGPFLILKVEKNGFYFLFHREFSLKANLSEHLCRQPILFFCFNWRKLKILLHFNLAHLKVDFANKKVSCFVSSLTLTTRELSFCEVGPIVPY